METLLEGFENENTHQTDFWQILQDLQADPINLNTATERDLLQIPFLNREQAKAIIHFRNHQGKFTTVTQLQNVPGFPRELVEVLQPYLQLKPSPHHSQLFYRARIVRALNPVKGYEVGAYHNPNQVYQRIRWRPGEFTRLQAIIEKDAGESDWADFSSLSFRQTWRKAHSDFLIGDFQLDTGQRLVFSSPYGTPLVVDDALPFQQSVFRWRAKTAVEENRFLRGALWEYRFGQNISILAAFSRIKLDARIAENTGWATTLLTSGFHRTAGELAAANQLTETVRSVQLFREFSRGSIGFQVAGIDYDHPVAYGEGYPERSFHYLSIFHSFYHRGWIWQGEQALLNGKYSAWQQTLLFHPVGSLLRYGAAFYYYHPRYWAFHGRALGSISASPNNSIGFYLGIQARVGAQTRLAVTFHTSRPVQEGNRFAFLNRTRIVQAIQRLGNSEMLLRFTHRVRKASPGISIAREQNLRIARIQLRSNLSRRFRLTQRLEFSWSDSMDAHSKQYGISFYIDVRLRLAKALTVQTRWSQFDIPDFDFRLYEFENDLPGTFRNVLLNHRGYKWFVLMNYSIARRWKLSVKYREMWYPDETSLGDGLDMVRGNRRRELRLQIQFMG